MVAGLALVSHPAAARENLGLWNSWAAFRDARPARCYAIAEPVRPAPKTARWRPFASIATWPGRARSQVHIRLRRPATGRLTLTVGTKRFPLIAGGADAWAPDPRTDAAIVAAMRAGRSMSVETMGANGAPFADSYALRGAATAIDAAALGCAGR